MVYYLPEQSTQEKYLQFFQVQIILIVLVSVLMSRLWKGGFGSLLRHLLLYMHYYLTDFTTELCSFSLHKMFNVSVIRCHCKVFLAHVICYSLLRNGAYIFILRNQWLQKMHKRSLSKRMQILPDLKLFFLAHVKIFVGIFEQ